MLSFGIKRFIAKLIYGSTDTFRQKGTAESTEIETNKDTGTKKEIGTKKEMVIKKETGIKKETKVCLRTEEQHEILLNRKR